MLEFFHFHTHPLLELAESSMEKLKERVIAMLRESADRPVKLKEIARRLDIDVEGTRSLRTAVKELVEAGELVDIRGKRFGLPEHMNLIVGTLIGHPDGYGFVRPLPRPGQVNLPDIYVSGRDMNAAMHGDKVVTRISGHLTSQRIRGEIIRVLERANRTLVGYYEESRHFGYVAPVDARISQHIYVNAAEKMDARPGQVVTAEITAIRKGGSSKSSAGKATRDSTPNCSSANTGWQRNFRLLCCGRLKNCRARFPMWNWTSGWICARSSWSRSTRLTPRTSMTPSRSR
jgi:exoribonuclease R